MERKNCMDRESGVRKSVRVTKRDEKRETERDKVDKQRDKRKVELERKLGERNRISRER